jgi:hypothetical protein
MLGWAININQYIKNVYYGRGGERGGVGDEGNGAGRVLQ